jgi:RNA polymerase sigma-70 factor (ECF subfamily)
LAELCALYWPPVVAFIRRRGHDAAEAEDPTQGFFARLIEKGDPAHAVRVAVHRLRSRYREVLRATVAGTVAREDDVDDEIEYCLRVLSRP